MGKVYDYPEAQIAESKPSLGPFLKPEVHGEEVPYEYLLTADLPAIFKEKIFGAQIGDSGKDIYCFPFTSKDIKMNEWYERLDARLGRKWERLGLSHLIKISLTPMESNPKVCAALLVGRQKSLDLGYEAEKEFCGNKLSYEIGAGPDL